MDNAAEPRLPRKKPKTKRPPSSAQAPPPPAAEGGRGRDRFQSLWHDYHDLLQETEAKKRRLERMNRQKLRLLAEVKFLRKRFSSFVNDDPQQTHYSLKNKQARQQVPSTLGMNEGPSTSKTTNLDLNQDSAMNGVGAGCQVYQQDRSEPGKHDLAGVDEDIMNSSVNLAGYRGTGNSPASDDKRATTWQDQVALKNGEGAGRQGFQDHSEPGKHDLAGVDEDIMNSNANLSGYRDTGNSPASDDKRATAWQDRVALKI